jgi:hypothetical protein
MPDAPPPEPRRFATPDGAAWQARVLPSGRPSPYLAHRLARPLVEFRRLAGPEAVVYAPLQAPDLAALDEAELIALWRQARRY